MTNAPKARSNIIATTVLAMILFANVAFAQTAATKRARYLVLDARIIDKTENAELTVGVVDKHPANPLFKEDKPWEPRFDNPYCSVIYDEGEKIWKCWYSIFTSSGGRGDFPGEGLASEKRAWRNSAPTDSPDKNRSKAEATERREVGNENGYGCGGRVERWGFVGEA